MAWIARDKENVLFVYEDKPYRTGRWWLPEPYRDIFGIKADMVRLPDNADEKLIGRHLTWDDEPVEI